MSVESAFKGMTVNETNVYWHDGNAEYRTNIRLGERIFVFAVEQDENDRWVIRFLIHS